MTIAMYLADQELIPPKQWIHDKYLKCQYKIKRQNSFIDETQFFTVQNILQTKHIKVPQEWQYETLDYDENNQAMIDARNGIIPELGNYDPEYQNKDGDTVAMILAQQGIIPPREWLHNQNIKNKHYYNLIYYLQNSMLPILNNQINKNDTTIFDQAYCKQIPIIDGHKSDEQNEDGFTVAMILTINNINIPVEWQHDPNIQNKYRCTVAMYQARNGHIPDKIWYHNKYLRCKYQVENNPNSFMDRVQFYTVQNILQSKNIQVPQEWKYTSLNEEENNQAIINATNGIIPELDNCDPYYQNIHGDTVAMLLAEKRIIPPKVWMHNMNIINRFNKSLKEVLQYYKLPVPQHWQDNDILNIFDQACFRIIPNIENCKPEEQDENGFTVAMILAINNIPIPKCWYHKPEIQNKYGYTVAMIQASYGKVPDKQWLHNKYLRSHGDGLIDRLSTVQNILQQKNIDVPDEWYYEVLNYNEDNQAMIDARNNIMPELGNNDPEYQNERGETVAIIMAENKIMPPKEWMHNIDLQTSNKCSLKSILQNQELPVPHHWNDNDMTTFDQACFGEIPDITGHKSEEQDEDGWTIAMILAIKNISIPEEWQHNPDLENKYGMTVGYLLAKNKIIPPKYWIGDTSKQYGENQQTIAMILLQNNLQIPLCKILQVPDYCYHDPSIQNNYGYTVAMILANKGIIPSKEWNHNPLIQDNYKYTVAIKLAKNGIIPPRQWMHDINLQNKCRESIKSLLSSDENFQMFCKHQLPVPHHWNDNNMNQFDQAIYKQIPKLENHKPEEQDEDGWTVAMILAFQGIMPPREWMHDYKIVNKYHCNLEYYLQSRSLPVPQHYHDNDMTIFDQAYFGITPNIEGHKSDEQDEQGQTVAMILASINKDISQQLCHKPDLQDNKGNTVAMILARNNVEIPECWYHNPLIINKQGMTVAMIQAENSKIPDKQWQHDKYLRRKDRYQQYTVQNILQMKNIEVPQEWRYEVLNKQDDNQAMIDAKDGIIPEIGNYDPNYQNKDGWTVAMILAKKKIIPPKEWHHDPLLINRRGFTVALILAQDSIIPPKEWMYDIDLDIDGRSIRSLLLNRGYVYVDNQFILNYKTQTLNDSCQICLNKGVQQFMITKCNHKICQECFKQLLQNYDIDQCPICKQYNWYEQYEEYSKFEMLINEVLDLPPYIDPQDPDLQNTIKYIDFQ